MGYQQLWTLNNGDLNPWAAVRYIKQETCFSNLGFTSTLQAKSGSYMFCTVSNFKDVQSQLSFVNIGSYPSHKSFKSLKQKSPFFGFQMFPVARPPETIARNLALAAQERSMDTTAKVRVLRATLGPDTQKAKTTNFLATRVSEGLGKT